MELTPTARKRGLIVLLVATFCMWAGFFMVIPLVSIHYVDDLGWAPAVIGLVLGVRQFTQQGLAMFGGVLSDRFGTKWLVCLGMLVRALGFASMAWASTLPLLFASVVLAALGGALFEAPRSAAIAALTTAENRARFYSLSGVIGGLGMTLGPLLGVALLRIDFSFVCLAAAICFMVAFVVATLLLPNVRSAPQGQRLSHGLGLALRDRPFMLFTLLLMGFWFMWSQLTISLPLAARALTGSNDSVGLLYALNSGMIVVLQYPLMWLVERWLRPLTILCIGVLLMAIGLGAVAAAHSMPALLACVALFSFGGLLASPTQQTVAAELANPTALGSYFGVNMLALAFGGGLGSFLGGWMYGVAQRLDTPAVPWLVCAGVGLASASGLCALAWGRRTTGKLEQVTGKTGQRV